MKSLLTPHMRTSKRLKMPSPKKTLVAAAAVASLLPQLAQAVDATWTGALTGNTNDVTHTWTGTTTNWSTGTIPTTAGDNITFANNLSGNLTVFLGGAVTAGTITNLDTNNEINIQNGTGGSITFDTGSVTVPSINVSARTGGVGLLLFATVNGTNGLSITGSPTTEIRVNGSTNWAGFSGGLTITQGVLSLQADTGSNTVLPTDERLTLGTVGTTNFNLNNRNATIGSLAGTSSSFIYTSVAASSRTLTVGDSSTDANFAGTIGMNSSGANLNVMGFAKQGTGTQTVSGSIVGLTTVTVNTSGGTLLLSGSNSYTGQTTVNSLGTLIVSGTHNQGTGANAGRYIVNSGGTLGGNGAILLSDTSGGLTGMSVSGVLSPGQAGISGGIGNLTINATNSVRSALAMEAGGTFSFQLDAGLASDRITVIGGAQASDVFFTNTVINFSDLTGGSLAAGQYLLVDGDAATGYSGLTVDGGGFITAGLTIGTGLGDYTGSTLQLVGNDIVLNVVPEPSTMGLLGLGLCGAAGWFRRSRRLA